MPRKYLCLVYSMRNDWTNCPTRLRDFDTAIARAALHRVRSTRIRAGGHHRGVRNSKVALPTDPSTRPRTACRFLHDRGEDLNEATARLEDTDGARGQHRGAAAADPETVAASRV